jgi:hypothetical protein
MVTNVAPEHFALPKKGKKQELEAPKFKLASKMDEVYRVKEKLSFNEEPQG